jgi:cyclophilin family peptidyl-prolyl cis-trans isomerase
MMTQHTLTTNSNASSDSYDQPARVSLVHCSTTAGPVSFKLFEKWSPNGYDRALELFWRGFYDGSHFYYVNPDHLAMFGMSYSTDEELVKFSAQPILDDPPLDTPIEFEEGMISFDGRGRNTRDHQLFVALGSGKDFGRKPWEVPIGKVVEGLDNVKNLFSGYGRSINLEELRTKGKSYMTEKFPQQDHFINCLATDIDLEGAEDLNMIEEKEMLNVLKDSMMNLDTSRRRLEVHRELNQLSHDIHNGLLINTGMDMLYRFEFFVCIFLVFCGFQYWTKVQKKTRSIKSRMRSKSYCYCSRTLQ